MSTRCGHWEKQRHQTPFPTTRELGQETEKKGNVYVVREEKLSREEHKMGGEKGRQRRYRALITEGSTDAASVCVSKGRRKERTTTGIIPCRISFYFYHHNRHPRLLSPLYFHSSLRTRPALTSTAIGREDSSWRRTSEKRQREVRRGTTARNEEDLNRQTDKNDCRRKDICHRYFWRWSCRWNRINSSRQEDHW